MTKLQPILWIGEYELQRLDLSPSVECLLGICPEPEPLVPSHESFSASEPVEVGGTTVNLV